MNACSSAYRVQLRSQVILILCLALCALIIVPGSGRRATAAPPLSDYSKMRDQAEAYYKDGSFALARDLYRQLNQMTDLPAEDARWVEFRVADTTWRAEAGSNRTDQSTFDKARLALEKLIRDISRPEDRDRVWAEVNESLGDFFWERYDSRNWSSGWGYYAQALDWWAGAVDVELARERYLGMVWRLAEPSWQRREGWWGWHNIPLNVIENAATIAQTEVERARAHYLLAITLARQGGAWPQRLRVEKAFEQAMQFGPNNDWHDDALYQYAQWLTNNGRVWVTDDGQWKQEPDFVEAVKLYRTLITTYQRGDSRWWDDARNQIEQITSAQLNATVSNIFLPGSEVQFDLNWRNIKTIELALYRVDLTRHVNLATREHSIHEWLQTVNVAAGERIRQWQIDTEDKGLHTWGNKQVRLEEPLPIGAYVLVASGGELDDGKAARELILITDLAVVIKSWRGRALAFVCDAMTGSPVANARVQLWDARYRNNTWTGRQEVKSTDTEGMAEFDLTAQAGRDDHYGLLVTVNVEHRQAFALGGAFSWPSGRAPWKIYAVTDRPAYRPEETVHWKFTARTNSGGAYMTPANQTIAYEISGPRGTVKEGEVRCNSFGSAWGQLPLDQNMSLGEYTVNFWNKGKNEHFGSATLFRIEEYKLPEFEVTVQLPRDEHGRVCSFRLGDRIEATIEANYYFGGPVANATVELVITQSPDWHVWRKPRDYPWYFESSHEWYGYRSWGGQQIIKRETIRTDSEGKAKVFFDSPFGQGQNLQYRIDARVTDASRREITGSRTVRVLQQRYAVNLQPERNIWRPNSPVEVMIVAADSNDQPVKVGGTVTVFRNKWKEVWLDPFGRELFGSKLDEARSAHGDFPPSAQPGMKPWRLKFRGYEQEKVLERAVSTSDEGKATFSFTPPRIGYYTIAWRSPDPGGPPVQTSTTVWVTDRDVNDLEHHVDGVDLIVDKDTFRAGEAAAVMISTPVSNRWVLLTAEGDDLHNRVLVHVTGTVKLVSLPIEEKHIPNFSLNAVMISDGQQFTDSEQIIVPPVDNFLTLDVAFGEAGSEPSDGFKPRDQTRARVTVRDARGKPVAAEVSFALVDESVFYIQQDYAGDPREFFFNDRQGQVVATSSTLDARNYIKLVMGDDKKLIDERVWRQLSKDNLLARDDEAELSEALSFKSSMHQAEGGRRRNVGRGGGIDGLPAPASAAMERADNNMRLGVDMMADSAGVPNRKSSPPMPGESGGGGGEPVVVVRSDFRSTIVWRPDIVTGSDGTAEVDVNFADSLTRWKGTARAFTNDNKTGIVSVATRTRLPLVARLQAPRFFTKGDEVTVSGVFNNNTDTPMLVTPLLETSGLTLGERILRPGDAAALTIPPGGEARADWRVLATLVGEAKVTLTGKSDRFADAMVKTYTVQEHGIERYIAKSGKVRGDEVTIILDLPAQRRKDSTQLTVQVTPSMAVTMLDALPYLVDYPYGCTEQTMSRFLPAAIVARTLQDAGLSVEQALARTFGGIEQQFLDKTHPNASKGRENFAKMQEIINANLARLYDFQHSDGGWGWWKGGESDHFMTAYVLWGLSLAAEADLDVQRDVMDRAARYIDSQIVEAEREPDLQAWMLHAIAANHKATAATVIGRRIQKAIDNLWADHTRLNAYTRSLFALALHQFGDAARAQTLVRNLQNGVMRDSSPDASILLGSRQRSNPATIGTAHWGEDGIFWRWSDGGVEATAFALRAMLAIDPKNELIEPTTNWLVKNRRGAQWSNTRDTAITVLALNDYLKISGELKPEMEFDVLVNDKVVATQKISAAEELSAPAKFTVEPQYIRDGRNEVRIVKRRGDGPIYFAAHAAFFSLEEPIPATGNELFVRRDYYKLVPRKTLLKGVVYDRVVLGDGDYVTSGERVEVVLTIEAKNNYEYLVFEDLKPAGLEAVEIRSGESMTVRELRDDALQRKFASNALPHGETRTPGLRPQSDYTGRDRWVHQELRDRKVAAFIDRLPQGTWELRYDLRAEVPGRFHGLPVLGHAMYVPEIRCNSDEVRINVQDRE